MMSVWAWIADGVLAVLLIGTLRMAIRLDKALRVIRTDRGAFEALIKNLGAATGAVKSGIQALRQEADAATARLEPLLSDADRMATDLSFLIDAANSAGSRLEQHLVTMPGLTPRPRPKMAGVDFTTDAGS